MHKIMCTGTVGTFEWTPPGIVQERFGRKSLEVGASAEKWMTDLIKSYLEALLLCQSTRIGQDLINEATTELSKVAAGMKQPRSHLH